MLILSCEHGGNQIPAKYRSLFRKSILASHRGWDQGALEVAKALSRELKAELYFAQVSRLLVDLNRSREHPRVASPCVRALPTAEQEEIFEKYYFPYRVSLERQVRACDQLIHLSIHSFTPVLKGQRRKTDIGVLYDPSREAPLALKLREALQEQFPRLKVHLNLPYRGTADGLTTYLRTRRSARQYQGVEIEFNQAVLRRHKSRSEFNSRIAQAIRSALL